MANHLEKVVILGCGSYNPVTYMHLRMFEIAKDYLTRKGSFQVIGGIISPVNDGYKANKYLASACHRLQMINLALKPLMGHQNWIQTNDWESRQENWVKTLEVLKYHQKRLNVDGKKVRIMLLCGSDMFETFNVPNRWDDHDIETIIKDFGLLVIVRDTSDPWKTLRDSSKSPILLKHEKNIFIIEQKAPNYISSSYIRECISKKESIRYLLDDSVIEYIEKNKIYQNSN